MIERAETHEFRPVLYIVPYERVEGLVIHVPAAGRANPFSVEYRIEQLRNDCFDLLELRR